MVSFGCAERLENGGIYTVNRRVWILKPGGEPIRYASPPTTLPRSQPLNASPTPSRAYTLNFSYGQPPLSSLPKRASMANSPALRFEGTEPPSYVRYLAQLRLCSAADSAGVPS